VFPIIRGNSQWISNNDAWLRGTSNWVNAKDELVRTTSNWVNANAGLLVATSNTVNNLFPIIRGNSQWIVNNGPRILQGLALSSLTVSTETYNLTTAIRLGTTSSLIFASNCVFNGGGNDIILQPGSIGVINVGGYNVTFKNVRFVNFSLNNLFVTPASGFVTFGDGTEIEFAQNESLPTPSITNMQFAGNVRLNGKGQWLDLTNTASLTIGGHRSSLMLDNITIKNLRGTMLRSLDANSTLSLKDTVLKLSSTYTFTQGHLEVISDSKIMGDGQIFSYESPQTSSICSRAMLTIDQNTTFSYSPYGSTNKGLIWQPDITSVLYFNSATLKTTTTGIQFKCGTLLVDGKVNLYNNNATSLSEAIIFGDGAATNDVNISIMPAASINLQTGLIDYRNAS
jgi:hypothetical protein